MIPSPAVISACASVTTSATTSAVFTHDGSTYWFISGFEVTYGGATAGSVKQVTLSGLLGGTLTYELVVPTGVTTGGYPLIVDFEVPLAGVDQNTDVVLALPAMGAGQVGASAVLHGYRGARQLNS